MSRKFAHLDFDYLRGPSPAIWKTIPDGMADLGYGGVHFFDDFLDAWSLSGVTTAAQYNKYLIYSDTGQTLASGTDVVVTDPSTLTAATDDAAAGYDTDTDWDVGTLVMAGDATDEDESSIRTSASFIINKLSLKKLAFEFRFKTETVANANHSLFIGLSDTVPADSALTDATGDLAAADNVLGFLVDIADGDALRPVYQAGSQTQQLKGTAAMTADKYIKAGFLLDVDAAPSKRGKFFINGVEQTTYITQANFEAATFPNDIAMGLGFYRKLPTAADVDYTLDWWKIFMEVDRV